MNSFLPKEIVPPLLFVASLLVFLWGAFLLRRPVGAVETPGAVRPDRATSTDWGIAATIAVVFYLVALWRLGVPGEQVFDEIYHARSGMEYVAGLDPHEWTHPPLAKLIIAASIVVWHGQFDATDAGWKSGAQYTFHQSFAWRYPSLVFGCGVLILLYILARQMFRSRPIATGACCLMALDGVFFVQSRIAMTNTFTVFFVLAATIGTWHWLQGRGEARSVRYLLLTGLGLGLALATRWSTLYVWGLTGLALLWHLWAVLLPHWRREKRLGRGLAGWVGVVFAAMVLIPVVIYAASYIPFVLQGQGSLADKLLTWSGNGHGWARATALQGEMWTYHATIKEKHGYSSPWWSWPLMLRPTWYFFDHDENNMARGIWAIGNGLIWWATVPALVVAAFLARREKSPALGLLALLGLGQWLLWGVEPRPLIFMHYLYESIPFVCIALSYLLWRLWTSPDKSQRVFAALYVAAVVIWAILFYPLLSAYPISDGYYQWHLWLGRAWI